MSVYDTPAAINNYIITVLIHALEVYDRTGIKVNRAYTPKNMMARASQITGKTFRARDYQGAIVALKEKRDER